MTTTTRTTDRHTDGRSPSPRRPRHGAAGALGRLRAEERGSALAFAALAFLGILGMLALAIDLGMLYETRGQAQRTADAAALAGAGALVDYGNDPGVEDRAYEYAEEYVDENPVRGELASLEPGDVDVDLDEWRVTVTVHRTVERENPVSTLFGRIIGKGTVDVRAIATAEAAEAGGAKCLLPLAIPDRWYDTEQFGVYDPEEGDDVCGSDDCYIPWPEENFTGYSNEDIGEEILIKPFQGDGSQMNESWYYPWRPPGQQGADDYRQNILECMDEELVYEFGDTVDTEPGNMAGPTRQGFEDLIDQDPDAYWDSANECVTRGDGCIFDSPRIRPAPMFDPREAPDPGSKPFVFRNFANVFVEELEGKGNVYVRFLGLGGVPGGDTSGDDEGPAVRFVRLIQ